MMFNNILVTAVKNRPTGQIIVPGVSDAVYSDVQEVVEVGPNTAGVKKGDLVLIKVENFFKQKTNSLKEDIIKEFHEVVLPIHEFGEDEYMLMSDRDIMYYWEGGNDE